MTILYFQTEYFFVLHTRIKNHENKYVIVICLPTPCKRSFSNMREVVSKRIPVWQSFLQTFRVLVTHCLVQSEKEAGVL